MKKKLSLLVKSLHPAHSRQLSERLLGQTISFYFTFVIVGLLLMLGIFMGLNWNKPFDINQLDASKTITLVDRPKVTLGPALNESESFLAFTPQEVGYDRFIFFGRTSSIYKNELTLLLLPGIVLLIGAISLGFSIILALLSSAIAFASTRKHKTSFRDLLVINFHY
ncbi:MAG: hypothetical protein KC535_02460, partial [Nanoarchaeota archaeon]|nr:hypothetical protein [Nanoarchaeota archaeon]